MPNIRERHTELVGRFLDNVHDSNTYLPVGYKIENAGLIGERFNVPVIENANVSQGILICTGNNEDEGSLLATPFAMEAGDTKNITISPGDRQGFHKYVVSQIIRIVGIYPEYNDFRFDLYPCLNGEYAAYFPYYPEETILPKYREPLRALSYETPSVIYCLDAYKNMEITRVANGNISIGKR
jgi:hypothetical protein